MPRRAAAGVRPIDPDPVHGSRLVQQVVNKVMIDGKKSTAEHIVYDALETLSRRTGQPPVEALEASIKALTPVLEHLVDQLCDQRARVDRVDLHRAPGGRAFARHQLFSFFAP